MPAISVGSVEVDVLPNARGIRQRLQRDLVPAADEVGEEIGRVIGRHVSTQVASAIRNGVTTGGRQAQPAAARQGQSTGSTFGRSFKATLEAALASLPEVRLRADSSDAEREIYQIRAQMRALADARIGIDISTATANAAIAQLQARLQRLSATDADVAVRVDAGAASAQLAAFQAQVNRLDGQTANVDVDTRSAAANLNLLTTAALAFGPAIIPVLPVVAAGLGAIAAAATAAAVGVGAVGLVAIPAIKGIATTLQAQKAAQDAATNATYQGGQAASQGASKALQLAGAQQALATASRNGARQIKQAEQGITDAVRSASEGNRRAKQQLADAVEQAADRQERAAEQVRSAEDNLADAQRSARQAQQDLNQARRDAAQDLAELGDRLANAELSERDAVLSVQEARERLRAVQAKGSKASVLEQQRAQLAYDEAVQRLKEQQAETKALAAEKKAADKAGVEGSQTVKDAQESLRQADEAVTKQQKELAKARSDAAKQQVEAQQAVAEAQRNVARTQEDGARSVARAQEQLTAAQQGAADSIASAQRQIEQASLSAAGGVDQAAIAQAKYRAELAKLTPAARDTMNAYVGLRTAFNAWSKSLQPAVMPIFTRALNGLKNSLPGLTPFVTEAADAIGGLQDRVSRGFKSPWWNGFKADLEGSVGPAITGLGISFGRIFKGMAGVIQAFLPHMDSISGRMQDITGRFAAWGTGLKGSPEFERFLAYSSEHAPMIAEALGKLFTALLDVGKALSPISDLLLQVIGDLSDGISWIATNMPGVIQLLYGYFIVTRIIRLAVLGWAAAQAIANGALLAFQLIASAGPWGWIVLAILAVIAAVVYLYNRFDWFRNLVQTVWSAIQTAALWAWNNVLKPTFAAILLALQTVGKWATWLWENAIKPAFDAIVLAGKILATAIVVAVILPIIVVFKALGLIAGWLWENAIRPAFRAIAALAVWLYRNIIKPQFDAVVAVFRAVAKAAAWLWKNALSPVFRAIGDAAKWLYTNAIKPAFGWIADRATWLWNKGVKPAFDLLKGGLKAVGDAFKTAKDYIGEQWSKVRDVARKPIQYVVDVVYNNGIRGVWNKVADAFGAPKLPKYTFASGGVMPGYTPGRDVHKFVSPTGGRLELSGGEAIMRPEFTRAVGSGFVGAMNSIARSRGAQGVKAALAPVFGGNPSTPTDTSLRYANGGITQKFADGGIFGWIKSAASKAVGAGSAAWNKIKDGAGWLKDTLEASARAGVKNIVTPLLKSFPGMDTGFGQMIRRMPNRIVDALFGYSKEADKKGGGGIGGPKVQAALRWAKTQNGLPYQWGGNGNPSWDCCIVGTVRVYGPNGATPIQEVQAGDEVYSYVDGKLTAQTVTAAWKSKTQPVFKVRTRNRAVTASANHPFMRLVQTAKSEHVKGGKRGEQIPAKYGIEWARLDELKRGDLLVQPREMEPAEVGDPALPDGTPVTGDIAWLLGLFIGDGYLNQNTVRICVYDDLSVRAQNVFRSLGANSFTGQKHGVVASSTHLVETLTEMGFDKPGPEKRVPDAVWTWSRELRQAFLDGYCDADGHRPKNRSRHGDRTYASASRELIEDVRAMHIMLDQPASNISTNNRVKPITIKGKVVKKALPLHSFTVWAGEGRGEVALRRLPGVASWLDAGDFTLTRVLEVSDEGVQETYDLEVEGAHNFIADGVVVHNSGYMSAIESVIRGQKPHRRWSTHAFSGNTAPPGWVKNGASAFKVGITAAGVGHTAGTLGKTKVESRGGDGVIVGSRARGYNDRLFTDWYGFKPGSYDSGGYLQPGLNLAYNGTGRPEPVFTTGQANALTSMANRSANQQLGDLSLNVWVGNEGIASIARAEVHNAQGELIQVLNAN